MKCMPSRKPSCSAFFYMRICDHVGRLEGTPGVHVFSIVFKRDFGLINNQALSRSGGL